MSQPSESILREVLDNPFRLVTADELRVCIGKSINFVLAAKNAGAPFPGNVTRPEWFLAWLHAHPKFVVEEFASKAAASKTHAKSAKLRR